MLKFKYCAVDLGRRGREGGGSFKEGKTNSDCKVVF